MLNEIELRTPRWFSGRGIRKVIAPAFTVQFQPKGPGHGDVCMPRAPASNIEPGVQWSDLTEPDKIVVVQQPEGQKCAVLGGIHAVNIDGQGAHGIIISGRIRDIQELQKLDTPVRWYAALWVVSPDSRLLDLGSRDFNGGGLCRF